MSPQTQDHIPEVLSPQQRPCQKLKPRTA